MYWTNDTPNTYTTNKSFGATIGASANVVGYTSTNEIIPLTSLAINNWSSTAPVNGFSAYACNVQRQITDNTAGLIPIKIGQTVNYRAGFQFRNTANGGATAFSVDKDLMFTILDNAVALAASTVTLATAVYAMTF